MKSNIAVADLGGKRDASPLPSWQSKAKIMTNDMLAPPIGAGCPSEKSWIRQVQTRPNSVIGFSRSQKIFRALAYVGIGPPPVFHPQGVIHALLHS